MIMKNKVMSERCQGGLSEITPGSEKISCKSHLTIFFNVLCQLRYKDKKKNG